MDPKAFDSIIKNAVVPALVDRFLKTAPVMPDGTVGDPAKFYVVYWPTAADAWRGAGFKDPAQLVRWLKANTKTLPATILLK